MANYNFSPTSRYYAVGTTSMVAENGQSIVYLQRRFIPPPERFSTLQEHVVSQGERIDQLAGKYLGDPQMFWRIADANRAMQAETLTEEMGQRLRITLPDGVPGLTDSGGF